MRSSCSVIQFVQLLFYWKSVNMIIHSSSTHHQKSQLVKSVPDQAQHAQLCVRDDATVRGQWGCLSCLSSFPKLERPKCNSLKMLVTLRSRGPTGGAGQVPQGLHRGGRDPHREARRRAAPRGVRAGPRPRGAAQGAQSLAPAAPPAAGDALQGQTQ